MNALTLGETVEMSRVPTDDRPAVGTRVGFSREILLELNFRGNLWIHQ